MVIVRLMGGMGNQMFQYAFGKNLADLLGTKLLLDHSFFQRDFSAYKETPRSFELDKWGIPPMAATAAEIASFQDPDNKSLISRLASRLQNQPSVFREKQFRFDPQALQLKNPAYLYGHWQSEKYFIRIKNQIVSDFQLPEPAEVSNQQIPGMIRSAPSVGIHIRRKDYVDNPIASAYHPTCSESYYKEALALLRQHHPDLRAYLFSDDKDWARENLKLDIPFTVVDLNADADGHKDLWLMSRCEHQIIANSSFSWWAAWLNPNQKKSVIAPKHWFTDPAIDTSDLIPSSWICL